MQISVYKFEKRVKLVILELLRGERSQHKARFGWMTRLANTVTCVIGILMVLWVLNQQELSGASGTGPAPEAADSEPKGTTKTADLVFDSPFLPLNSPNHSLRPASPTVVRTISIEVEPLFVQIVHPHQ